MENFQELIKKSKEIYSSFKPIKCPILNNELVFFTNSGFTHMIRKKRKERTKEDQIRRLKLIPFIIKNILEADQIFTTRKIKQITFWSIGNKNSPKTILCKNTKGPIYFVSIIP